MSTRSHEPETHRRIIERPHTFTSFARLYRRLTTTNPPEDLSPNDRTNLLFTMSKQHAEEIHEDLSAKPILDECDQPARRALGGARRDRTDDLMLAKHALSQLSYGPLEPEQRSREWWARKDLNLRPHAYQARALTS